MIVVMRPGSADNYAKEKLRRMGVGLIVADGWALRDERTAFIAPTVDMPWDLLSAGEHFLERWHAAAPLWRYGVLAADVGTPSERERTQAVTLDLRIPLYAPDLLFIRRGTEGERLLSTWREECTPGDDERLAFLRALCRVKPLFLALPRSWLRERDTATALPQGVRLGPGLPLKPQPHSRLVHVEIAPGRYVCCRPEETQQYREQFAKMQERRTSGARRIE